MESSLPHPTVDERAAAGRAARARASRWSHAALESAPGRDPISLLAAQDAGRIPELVPIRYGRMLASPFAFFRGAAAVMAHDLAELPSPGLHVQLSGDAHLSNFGGFASAERRLVFDLNDFDETLPGPFEWDVKRLAASLEIASRERGFKRAERSAAVLGAVRAYREAMRGFAAMGDVDVWYSSLDADAMLDDVRDDERLSARLQQAVAKARANDGRRALATLTRVQDGEARFVSEPPLIVPLSELGEEDAEDLLHASFRRYRRSLPPERRVLLERFRYVDLARKAVGVGSVGTRCWVILLTGRDAHDPLLLQIKEAEPSVLEGPLGPGGYTNQGERIVVGQRLMQASSDIFLGWARMNPDLDGASRDYYIRQLRDWKVSLDVETVVPSELARYAAACGWTLARAHARSGDRIAIAAYLGGGDRFDRAVRVFASAYADLNERDHAALREAVAAGRVTAAEDI
jgi:uncharacterized protein (DUF2252 family)